MATVALPEVYIRAGSASAQTWDGSCAQTACTRDTPCGFNSAPTEVTGDCIIRLFQSDFGQQRNITLNSKTTLRLAYIGVISNLKLTLSAPKIEFGLLDGLQGSYLGSMFRLALTSDTVIQATQTEFTNSGFTVEPTGLTRFRTDWNFTGVQFNARSRAAPFAIFDLPLPAGTTELVTGHRFTFESVVASFMIMGSDRSRDFIRSEAHIELIEMRNSLVAGCSTFLHFVGPGFGRNLMLKKTGFSQILTSLTTTERFAKLKNSSFSSSSSSSRASAIVNDPEDYPQLRLFLIDSNLASLDQGHALPTLGTNGVNLISTNSKITGLNVNCDLRGQAPIPFPTLKGTLNVGETSFSNCATCFSDGYWAGNSFFYMGTDSRIFTSVHPSTSKGLIIHSTSFTDINLTPSSRLFFSSGHHPLTNSDFTTNCMNVQAGTSVELASARLSGIITLGAGSSLYAAQNAPSPNYWHFRYPLQFIYEKSVGSDKPATVDVSNTPLLELEISKVYSSLAGLAPIFTTDSMVSVIFDHTQSVFNKLHVNWDAALLGPPSEIMPYYIGPFLLADFNKENKLEGDIPKGPADVYSFVERLHPVAGPKPIFMAQFALNKNASIH